MDTAALYVICKLGEALRTAETDNAQLRAALADAEKRLAVLVPAARAARGDDATAGLADDHPSVVGGAPVGGDPMVSVSPNGHHDHPDQPDQRNDG